MDNIFAKFPDIDLGEIILREIKVTDAKDFFEYVSDENVRKYTEDEEIPASITSAENDLLYWINLFTFGRSIYWAIADAETNKMIGSCGFNYWNKQHGRLEISYDLNHNFWGKGIATKAVTAITYFIFNNTTAQRVQATVATDNERSIKVLERAGYTREGTIAKYFILKGVVKDGYMYAKVRV